LVLRYEREKKKTITGFRIKAMANISAAAQYLAAHLPIA